MKLRFFTVWMPDAGQEAEELNAFLSSHRIVSVERHFVLDAANSAWAICVSYLPTAGRPAPEKRGRVDYREILPEAEFAIFAQESRLNLTAKEPVQINRSARGATVFGYRVLPGALRFSQRRRRRYLAALRAAEAAYLRGRQDALGLQGASDAALAITAHAAAVPWRHARRAARPGIAWEDLV